eukprot:685048-Rhodomonas_salina.3
MPCRACPPTGGLRVCSASLRIFSYRRPWKDKALKVRHVVLSSCYSPRAVWRAGTASRLRARTRSPLGLGSLRLRKMLSCKCPAETWVSRADILLYLATAPQAVPHSSAN